MLINTWICWLLPSSYPESSLVYPFTPLVLTITLLCIYSAPTQVYELNLLKLSTSTCSTPKKKSEFWYNKLTSSERSVFSPHKTSSHKPARQQLLGQQNRGCTEEHQTMVTYVITITHTITCYKQALFYDSLGLNQLQPVDHPTTPSIVSILEQALIWKGTN